MKTFRLIFKIFPAAVLSLFFLGTTYVIKEGGVEVGRYEENDGKDEVRDEEHAKPPEVPLKEETRLEYSDDAGYTAKMVGTGKMVPDRKQTILVSGRVLDVLTLKPVSGGKILFFVELERFETTVLPSGMFSSRVPKPDNAQKFSVEYSPPAGYMNRLWIFPKGELLRMPLEARRLIARGVAAAPGPRESTVDLEIGVRPVNLPREAEPS